MGGGGGVPGFFDFGYLGVEVGFGLLIPPPLRGGFVFCVFPRVSRCLRHRFTRGYRPAPLRGAGEWERERGKGDEEVRV